jgi:hypothetical protein
LIMRGNASRLLAVLAGIIVVAGCNRPSQPASETPQAAADAARTEADAAAATAATLEKEAELARREAEVAEREADIAAAAAKSQKPPTAARPSPARPAPSTPAQPAASSPAASAPVVAPVVLVVPSGTQLSLSLATALSSKTAKVGDTVRATVTQGVRVGDRVAIAAGSTVAGTVTDVISGSNKIGGVPTLGLRFERLELPGNVDVPIDGVLTQKGKSDTGRDTAKIVGGAAAGAILGGQVKDGDKGKVLGGLLGGAIGAVAAQKTGTEVTLAEGTEFVIALAAPVEITRR